MCCGMSPRALLIFISCWAIVSTWFLITKNWLINQISPPLLAAPEHRLFSVQYYRNINKQLQYLDGGQQIQLPSVLDVLPRWVQITTTTSWHVTSYLPTSILSLADGSCGPIDWNALGLGETITVVPQITEIASRTGDFLYAYLVLSCVWIVSSMSLIGKRLCSGNWAIEGDPCDDNIHSLRPTRGWLMRTACVW